MLCTCVYLSFSFCFVKSLILSEPTKSKTLTRLYVYTLTRGLLSSSLASPKNFPPLLLLTSLTVGSPVLRIAQAPQTGLPTPRHPSSETEQPTGKATSKIRTLMLPKLPFCNYPGPSARYTWTALRDGRYSVGRGLSLKLS